MIFFSLVLLLLSFQKATSQCPDCGEYYFLLGQLYWDLGEVTRKDRNKAQTHLLKVCAIMIKIWNFRNVFILVYTHFKILNINGNP